MILKIKNNQFVNYVFFALITTIINVSVYLLCYKYLFHSIIISNIIAYVVSVTSSFVINKNLVFKNKNNCIRKQAFLFFLTKVLSFVIDTGVLYVLNKLLCMNINLSKIISNASTTISNYLLNKNLVFKNRDV